jgi:antitoxin ParD1/3/4
MRMNVSLAPELEQMIRQRVESGRYTDASEVVRDALRLLEEREHLQHLRSLLEEFRQSYYAFSAYDTVAALQQQIRQTRGMGRHIFRYDIPEESGITWMPSIAPGHYDLFGDGEELKHYLIGYVCDVWDEDAGDQTVESP